MLKSAALGLLASVSSFQIADADEYKPRRAASAATTAPTTQWSGLQTGANGGSSSLAQNFAEPGAYLCPNPLSCVETPFEFSGHPTSLTFGGFLGYRVQFGGLVVGVEGDASWKRAQDSYYLQATPAPGVTEAFSGTMRQGWDGSFRGRVGALLGPTLLAYATAGLALGEVGGSFSYVANHLPSLALPGCPSCSSVSGQQSWSDTRLGYTIGAGLETSLGSGLKARIEYRYTDFGDFSKNVPLTANCVGSAACGTNARIDMEAAFHTVRLGIGIELN